MRFKAKNLLMGALVICLVATLAFAERPAGRQLSSGALSGRPSSPSFSGMGKGQPVGSGFRSTPRQERLSPSIGGNTSSKSSLPTLELRRISDRAGSFGGTRGEMTRTRADKPQIPQGSLSRERMSPGSWNNVNTKADKSHNAPVDRTRDSSRIINRDDNRRRSDSFNYGFTHRDRDNVSVAVSSSHRDNVRPSHVITSAGLRHYRSYNYRGRSHYGYNGYWYYPWSSLGVTYFSNGLGFYVNSGYPVGYTNVWVPGYWETYYVTEEFLNSNGRICYRYVPYRIWVSGYWSTSYWNTCY